MVLGVGFLPWTLLLPFTAVFNCRRWRENNTAFLLLWAVVPFAFFSLQTPNCPITFFRFFPLSLC